MTVLHVLGTLDGAFLGFRAAQGRSGLIRRGWLDARAMLFGAVIVQIGLVSLEILGLGLVAARGPAVLPQLTAAGIAMAWVYGAYAAVIALGYALRLAPSIDLRAFSSLAVFGPATLLRVPVLVAGGAAAILTAPTPEVALLAVLVVGTACATGRWIDRAGARFER